MKIEIKNSFVVVQNFFILSILLPCIYGCQGGGGGGSTSSLGSLFNSYAGSGGVSGGAGGGSVPGGEAGVATIVNPEPATVLLLGSGIVAMRFLSDRMKK